MNWKQLQKKSDRLADSIRMEVGGSTWDLINEYLEVETILETQGEDEICICEICGKNNGKLTKDLKCYKCDKVVA